MFVRDVVYHEIYVVAEQQGKAVPALHDTLPLMESGLDSLCIAIIIAKLDETMHVSPFDEGEVEIPMTIGDLVQLYERTASSPMATRPLG